MDNKDIAGLAATVIAISAPFISYFVIFKVTARLSGWTDLARKYAALRTPEGITTTWSSLGTFRIGGYNNCMKFIVNAEGLYLALHWPFAAFHPPLLFPWNVLRKTGAGKSFGVAYTEIEMPGGRRWKFIAKTLGPALERGWLK